MRVVKLGDVCDVITRGISPIYTEDKQLGVAVLNQKCIRDKTIAYEFGRLHNLSEKSVNDSKFLKSGDVLVNSTGHGTLGRTALVENVDQPALVDSHITILRPANGMFVPRYFAYLIGRCEKDFVEMATGTSGQTELPRALVSEYQISYDPSLEEQQWVVERLDAAFEKIDRAIELTEENIKNSWYLFDAFRKEKFAGGDITKKLGEVLVLQRGYDLPKSQRVAGEHPLVSSSGIIDNINEYKVQGPGICTGRSGSVGATFYVENNFWPLNTTLYIKDYLGNDPRYCYWLLYGLDLKQFAGGTGVPTLNRNIVHEHMVKMSQGESQKEIANTLDTEYLLCQDLSTKYQKKLSSLKLLKQSLLTQAFSQNEVK